MSLTWCADRPWTGRIQAAGHGLWLLGLLWSPEAAFDTTFVWWPYYLWRSTAAGPTRPAVVVQLLRHMATLVGVLAAFVLFCCAGYYAIFRILPSPYAVFAYIIQPPGPIPFALTGAFLFLFVVFAAVICSVIGQIRRNDRPEHLNRTIPVALALYAVGSYYLGRSVDNNILNLSPFMLLALVAVLSARLDRRLDLVAQAGVCCLLAAVAGFGWSTFWGTAAAQGSVLKISAGQPTKLFTFANAFTDAALDRREGARNPLVHSADVERAVTQIWRDHHESAVLIAPPLVLITEHSQPWTAMHIPENFWFMPPFARQTFLRRAMHRLNRPGWVITQPDAKDLVAVSGRELARDFDAVYARGESLRFGSYVATRYAPRP